jgi:hypothetical protein
MTPHCVGGPTRKPLPDGTVPGCFGVNIHFTGEDPQLDMVAEGGFRGTVTYDLEPKPAYLAAKTLTAALAGCRFEERLALDGEDDYALLFAGGGRRCLAGWTTAEGHQARIPLAPGEGRLVEMLGRMCPMSWGEGGPALALSAEPAYILVGEQRAPACGAP